MATDNKTDIALRQDGAAPASFQAKPGELIVLITDMARDPAIDASKLQTLLNMQVQLEDRQAERDFIAAYGLLSQKIPRVPRNGVIPMSGGKSIPFARWEDMDKILRPLLNEFGFTLSFDSDERSGNGGGGVIIGVLEHRNGHSRRARIPLPLDTGPGRNNLQAMGSTLSYGKRYCAEMLLNIVREGQDDDGKSGGTKVITEDQINDLLGMLKEKGVDERRFLDSMGVNEIADIPAEAFVIAKNLLLNRKATAKK